MSTDNILSKMEELREQQIADFQAVLLKEHLATMKTLAEKSLANVESWAAAIPQLAERFTRVEDRVSQILDRLKNDEAKQK